MNMNITPQIGRVGNKIRRVGNNAGQTAKKFFLPFAVAGAIVAGAISCNSNKGADVPKTKIEMLRESVKEKEMQCKADSIEFAYTDSVLAKQDLEKVKALAEGLPLSRSEESKCRDKATLGDEIANKKLELAKNTKALVDYAQLQADIATGKVWENSKKALVAERDKLVKARQDYIATLDALWQQLDSFRQSVDMDDK